MQWRLQLWGGAMLVAVLAAFVTLAYRMAWLEELRRIDDELGESLDQMTRIEGGGPGGPGGGGPPPPPRGFEKKKKFEKKAPPRPGDPLPPGVEDMQAEIVRNIWEIERTRPASRQNDYYLFLNLDGSLLARSTNAPTEVPLPQRAQGPEDDGRKGPVMMPGPMSMTREVRTRGQFREVYRILPLGDAIIAGRSIEGAPARMRERLAWVAFASLGILAAGLAGGWWITKHALAPIQTISATASDIAAGDLSRRIDVASSDSELGQLAGVLNDTFARLETSFVRQARFTSDASHELRTPISVIVSKAQMTLARERTPAEYQEALRVCLRAAQRMRALTESLLTLSRLDADADPRVHDPLDLSTLTGETLDFLAERAAEHHVQLVRDLHPAPVRGEMVRLGQVVTNLVMNAIQHTPADGTVTIRTQTTNGEVHLEITDTGQGIAPADLPHVFDRFYRADKSRTGQTGTGLGLSITKGIVEAHGGRIEANSTPGAGATFLVTLPAAG